MEQTASQSEMQQVGQDMLNFAVRLQAMELNYHELGGLYDKLADAGHVDQLVTEQEVAHAVNHPPAGGRAEARGLAIQELHGQSWLCDWQYVVNPQDHKWSTCATRSPTDARSPPGRRAKLATASGKCCRCGSRICSPPRRASLKKFRFFVRSSFPGSIPSHRPPAALSAPCLFNRRRDMNCHRIPRILATLMLGAAAIATSGCVTEPWEGQDIGHVAASFRAAGYLPNTGYTISLQRYNFRTGSWETIGVGQFDGTTRTISGRTAFGWSNNFVRMTNLWEMLSGRAQDYWRPVSFGSRRRFARFRAFDPATGNVYPQMDRDTLEFKGNAEFITIYGSI